MKNILTLITVALLLNTAHAQSYKRLDSIQVTVNSTVLKNAWAGGLNCPQLSTVDLNGDGIKDLVTFDKSNNKISCFINKGTPGKIDYVFASQYRKCFPKGLSQFMLMADYNCDGKEDIFAYSSGGMAVYRNDYTVTDGLKFTKIVEVLNSQYYNKSLNLYVSPANLPAIADIDNDGDLDIFTFEVGGSYVEYHKNMSKELYGTCDSLSFVYQPGCWGHFTGNASSNNVTLNVNCKGGVSSSSNNSMHSGSTLLLVDMDADGDKEMIIGDVISNNLLLVTNGGTPASANMIAQDDSFPSNSKPANMATFPGAFFLDINNDGKRDLVAVPNAPNASENLRSVWYYKNTGTDLAPVFTYQQNNLLQDDMLETGQGCRPVFFDYNGDGLKDLVIGNDSYYNGSHPISGLSLYKNTGTNLKPAYELVTRDYAGISALSATLPTPLQAIHPTFGDLDGDGDQDMLVGNLEGDLLYYENTASAGQAANFVFVTGSYQAIDVGQFSTPQLVDINKDGKLDLLVGERNGNLNYYINTGTAINPNFALESSSFGDVDTRQVGYSTGYSVPYFFSLNGVSKLLVGSQTGGIFYYDNIDNNLSGTFNKLDSVFQGIDEGAYTSVSGADITDDGKIELAIGNYAGGMGIYSSDLVSTSISTNEFRGVNLKVVPNPADQLCTISLGRMVYDKNIMVTVYNLLGQQQMQVSTPKNIDLLSLDTSGLADGIYICKLAINDQSEMLKIVVQH